MFRKDINIRKLIRQILKESLVLEDITLPIEIGDEILGGKFLNKKTIVKDIGENEKGDITINGKPLLRFRIKKKLNEEVGKKQTCLYIHGLGAEISDDTKESLSEYNTIFPNIIYDNSDGPYFQCLEILKNNNVDFIIGHSVGGVIAFYLAKETNIPALLLCPAFGDEYNVYVSKSIKKHTPKMLSIIGSKDNEVDPDKIKLTLEKQPNCSIKELNIGHDITPKNLTILSKIFLNRISDKTNMSEGAVKTAERIDIYRDNNYVVVRPLTERAVCKYGAFTKWCISAPSSGAWESNPDAVVIMILQRNYNIDPKKQQLIDLFLDYKDKEDNGELTPEIETEMNSFFDSHDIHDFEDLSKIALVVGNNNVEIWDANNIPINDNYQFGWQNLPISNNVIDAIENYISTLYK